jgi:biotin transporter BioY
MPKHAYFTYTNGLILTIYILVDFIWSYQFGGIGHQVFFGSGVSFLWFWLLFALVYGFGFNHHPQRLNDGRWSIVSCCNQFLRRHLCGVVLYDGPGWYWEGSFAELEEWFSALFFLECFTDGGTSGRCCVCWLV